MTLDASFVMALVRAALKVRSPPMGEPRAMWASLMMRPVVQGMRGMAWSNGSEGGLMMVCGEVRVHLPMLSLRLMFSKMDLRSSSAVSSWAAVPMRMPSSR